MVERSESDLLAAVSPERDTVVDFLEWLEQNGLVVASLTDKQWTQPRYAPVTATHDRLATDYLGIDMLKVENERREMLAAIRKENAQ